MTDKVVGARRVGFAVLDEGHPHRASLTCNDDVGGKFGEFEGVGIAADSALGGHNTDVSGGGEGGHGFNSGAYYAEDVLFNGNIFNGNDNVSVNLSSCAVCVIY